MSILLPCVATVSALHCSSWRISYEWTIWSIDLQCIYLRSWMVTNQVWLLYDWIIYLARSMGSQPSLPAGVSNEQIAIASCRAQWVVHSGRESAFLIALARRYRPREFLPPRQAWKSMTNFSSLCKKSVEFRLFILATQSVCNYPRMPLTSLS